MPTKSGFSLNDIIAKGRNNMNRLVDIFLRWRGHAVAFHTDVQKMYNSVRLHKSHWALQRYLWQESSIHLNHLNRRSSRPLSTVSNPVRNEHPDIYEIVSKDIYVDDCLSGDESLPKVINAMQCLEAVINNGGFALKRFTFSGQHPSESLSKDGHSVSVAGLKWYPKDDMTSRSMCKSWILPRSIVDASQLKYHQFLSISPDDNVLPS